MASFDQLLAAMQNGVTAINGVITQLQSTFPQASSVSTSAATAGSISFGSSQAAGFLSITTSSGASYKVPLYT
jgi:hypothetical protein